MVYAVAILPDDNQLPQQAEGGFGRDPLSAKLRALRARYQATPPFPLAPQYSIPVVFSASNGSEYYDLSLRDTVPFEADGALAIEAFIQ